MLLCMKKILFIFPLLLLFSCMQNAVYSETIRGFTENRWAKADARSFEFTINEKLNSDIIIKFSHIFEPQYNQVPLLITIEKPTGNIETMRAELVLKDSDGKNISDCVGDICDLEYVLKQNYSLEQGKYTIRVANISKETYLPNVLGLGIEIRSSQ